MCVRAQTPSRSAEMRLEMYGSAMSLAKPHPPTKLMLCFNLKLEGCIYALIEAFDFPYCLVLFMHGGANMKKKDMFYFSHNLTFSTMQTKK